VIHAQENVFEERVFVALRTIGHELLLSSGDSASRVLPIKKDENRYKVQFESPFSFVPEDLSAIADSIMEISQVAPHYIIEVKSCDSAHVAYSYEKDLRKANNLTPCRGRVLPEDCYQLFLHIITPVSANTEAAYSPKLVLFLGMAFLFGCLLLLYIKRRHKRKNKHLTCIGNFLFDQKNMLLKNGKLKQELTGKETDLLQLLYTHLNATVERDRILKEVWKDEGDYIGRTLDVYISKLRKKFEADPAIRIVNIRGVGYKMTINEL
jgi:hypothetical protein